MVYGGNYRERRRGKASAYLHSGVSRHVAWKRRARFIQPNSTTRSESSRFVRFRCLLDDVNYTGGSFHRCCIRFILPSIRNYESLLHFFRQTRPSFLLPTFYQSARPSSHPILVPVSPRARNGACHNLSRASHLFFRGSKIETDEKPYFREHASHRRLPIIRKPTSPQLLSNNLSLMKC